jgi:hypothetical protein
MQQRDEPCAVGVEDALDAAAPDTFWQDVVVQQPQAVGPSQGPGPADSLIVGVAEGVTTRIISSTRSRPNSGETPPLVLC